MSATQGSSGLSMTTPPSERAGIHRHVWCGILPGLAAVITVAVTSWFAGGTSQSAGAGESLFDSNRASFSVRVGGEDWPYRIAAAFVLPGDTLAVSIVDPAPGRVFALSTPDGPPVPRGTAAWRWPAPPKPGLRTFSIVATGPPDTVRVNVFVMFPADRVREGRLNGYRIGDYPAVPLRGLAIYKRPAGFVEVTPETQSARVSPHFTLGQFVCKQAGDYPKYLVLRPRLLLKLETILEVVNERGFACDTFTVMSGYRTPFYNRAIGNVRYSRHVWGGAADIFIDVDPVDGVMDDLNGDKKIDYRDAAVLYDLVDALHGARWYEKLVGGLGRYKRTAAHGPFVHVDVRGFRARWGT